MKRFETIYGQDHIKKLLSSAFEQDHLSHAYLCEGRRGLGKYALALETAKTYLCDRYPAPACGACRSCLAAQKGNHPDLQIVFPFPNLRPESRRVPVFPFSHLAKEGARYSEETLKEVERFRSLKRENSYRIIEFEKKPNLPIEVIKDLRAYLDLKPQLSPRRAVIVLEVELMAHLAANVFLKTVEEPPGESLIILTTCNLGMILPTIKSRCQILHFAPIEEEVLKKALAERYDLNRDKIDFVVRAADGSLGLAEGFLEERVWELRDEVLMVLSDLLRERKEPPQSHAALLAGFGAERVFSAFLWIFRDLYLLGGTARDDRLINCDIEDRLKGVAARVPSPAAFEMAAGLTSRVEERYFTLNLDLEFSLVYLILKLSDLFTGKAR